MLETLLSHLEGLQYALLLLAGGTLALIERRLPRRVAGQGDQGARWLVNLGLYGIGVLLMLVLAEPVQQAALRLGSLAGWGGLAAASLPDVPKLLLGVLLVDLIQYGLHRMAHAIPLLWRLHQVHHADEALDVSSSVRHHPLEVVVLSALTLLVSAALGLPLLSLVLYVLLQLLHTLFCHANIALPVRVDAGLRWWLVTPDMHRVHHSVRMDEGNSNFGMVFPWWDRLLRSYHAQPEGGHQGMRLGLADGPAAPRQGLWQALCLPFRPFRPPSP